MKHLPIEQLTLFYLLMYAPNVQNKKKYLSSLFFYMLFQISITAFVVVCSQNIHNSSEISHTIAFILISVYLPSGILFSFVFNEREKLLKEYKSLIR